MNGCRHTQHGEFRNPVLGQLAASLLQRDAMVGQLTPVRRQATCGEELYHSIFCLRDGQGILLVANIVRFAVCCFLQEFLPCSYQSGCKERSCAGKDFRDGAVVLLGVAPSLPFSGQNTRLCSLSNSGTVSASMLTIRKKLLSATITSRLTSSTRCSTQSVYHMSEYHMIRT